MTHSTCPFCNAAVPTPSPISCPRCEERLPGGTANTPVIRANSSGSPRWFRVGFPLSCIASVFILVAGLYLVNQSKSKETAPATKPILSETGPATVPPLNLEAIAYLPANVQIVAALQTAPLEEFAKRTGTNGQQLLLDVGLPASIFESLARAGVPFESIDHLACGLTLSSDNVIPTVAIVVALKTPPRDPSHLAKRFEKEKLLNVLPISAMVVNERFLLAGSELKIFEMKTKPTAGEQLSASLRETIGKQVSPASVAWLATESQSWHELPSIKAAIQFGGRPDLAGILAKGRAASLSLSLEPELTVGLAVKCENEETAKSLQNHIGIKGAGQPWLIGGTEGWATLDAAVPPKEIAKLLGILLPAKK